MEIQFHITNALDLISRRFTNEVLECKNRGPIIRSQEGQFQLGNEKVSKHVYIAVSIDCNAQISIVFEGIWTNNFTNFISSNRDFS